MFYKNKKNFVIKKITTLFVFFMFFFKISFTVEGNNDNINIYQNKKDDIIFNVYEEEFKEENKLELLNSEIKKNNIPISGNNNQNRINNIIKQIEKMEEKINNIIKNIESKGKKINNIMKDIGNIEKKIKIWSNSNNEKETEICLHKKGDLEKCLDGHLQQKANFEKNLEQHLQKLQKIKNKGSIIKKDSEEINNIREKTKNNEMKLKEISIKIQELNKSSQNIVNEDAFTNKLIISIDKKIKEFEEKQDILTESLEKRKKYLDSMDTFEDQKILHINKEITKEEKEMNNILQLIENSAQKIKNYSENSLQGKKKKKNDINTEQVLEQEINSLLLEGNRLRVLIKDSKKIIKKRIKQFNSMFSETFLGKNNLIYEKVKINEFLEQNLNINNFKSLKKKNKIEYQEIINEILKKLKNNFINESNKKDQSIIEEKDFRQSVKERQSKRKELDIENFKILLSQIEILKKNNNNEVKKIENLLLSKKNLLLHIDEMDEIIITLYEKYNYIDKKIFLNLTLFNSNDSKAQINQAEHILEHKVQLFQLIQKQIKIQQTFFKQYNDLLIKIEKLLQTNIGEKNNKFIKENNLIKMLKNQSNITVFSYYQKEKETLLRLISAFYQKKSTTQVQFWQRDVLSMQKKIIKEITSNELTDSISDALTNLSNNIKKINVQRKKIFEFINEKYNQLSCFANEKLFPTEYQEKIVIIYDFINTEYDRFLKIFNNIKFKNIFQDDLYYPSEYENIIQTRKDFSSLLNIVMKKIIKSPQKNTILFNFIHAEIQKFNLLNKRRKINYRLSFDSFIDYTNEIMSDITKQVFELESIMILFNKILNNSEIADKISNIFLIIDELILLMTKYYDKEFNELAQNKNVTGNIKPHTLYKRLYNFLDSYKAEKLNPDYSFQNKLTMENLENLIDNFELGDRKSEIIEIIRKHLISKLQNLFSLKKNTNNIDEIFALVNDMQKQLNLSI